MDLHCVICYEEFNLTDRYPVVLPCGHTYICVVCAKRIKLCHECREPLYWNPPKPQQPTINNIHRSPAPARYARYNHSRYSPSTPPHNNAAKPEKREEVPLPLPKNVVLMDMIEAKQRQERIVAEQKAEKTKMKQERLREKQIKLQQRREEKENLRRRRQGDARRGSRYSIGSQDIEVDIDESSSLLDREDDEDEEFDYDDEISSSSSLPLGDPELNSGYAALSGTCGTYVVKEAEGLVVLPQDPNRPKHHVAKDYGDEKKEGSQHSSTHFSSIFNNADDENNTDNNGIKVSKSSLGRKEPFSIAKGQKVQVVGVLKSNEQGVYQLARGAGFVVAMPNQLVKVGAPEETSCKMEGMLQSVLEKQQEMQRKLDEISNLAIGLKKKIILEQEMPEEVPVISPLFPEKSSTSMEGEISPANLEKNNASAVNLHSSIGTSPHPVTPTRPRTPIGGIVGQLSTESSVNSTVVELGTSPRTPSQNSRYYTGEQEREFVYSPAHSCPMPSARVTAVNLDQPFLDDDAPSSPGVLRYRVNSDDESSGLGWAGVLGCGTSLFGERLLDSSDQGSANNIFNTSNTRNSDILRMSQTALMQQSNAQRRAAALAVAAGSSAYRGIGLLESSGSADSPLRRSGSYDGGGGGVNFRTGMSGHSGLGRPNRDFSGLDQNGESVSQPRRRMLMSEMSQHRGAATMRLGINRTGVLQRRSAAPDTLVGCQTIR